MRDFSFKMLQGKEQGKQSSQYQPKKHLSPEENEHVQAECARLTSIPQCSHVQFCCLDTGLLLSDRKEGVKEVVGTLL